MVHKGMADRAEGGAMSKELEAMIGVALIAVVTLGIVVAYVALR